MTTKNNINFPGLYFIWSNRTHFQYEKFYKNYKDNGFVVIPNLFDESKIKDLLADTLRLCREEGSKLSKTHLLTNEARPPSSPDELIDDDLLSHFLLLHFPHKMSSLFRSMLDAPELIPFLVDLIGPNVKCMQSMLFVKKSGRPGIKMSTLYPHGTAFWQECELHWMTLRPKTVVYG